LGEELATRSAVPRSASPRRKAPPIPTRDYTPDPSRYGQGAPPSNAEASDWTISPPSRPSPASEVPSEVSLVSASGDGGGAFHRTKPKAESSSDIHGRLGAQRSIPEITKSDGSDRPPAPEPPSVASRGEPAGGSQVGAEKAVVAPGDGRTKEEKDKEFRKKIAAELLATEKAYIDTLELLRVHYLVPMKSKKFPLPQHFYSVEVIGGINKELCRVLEERVTGWNENTRIGNAMLELGPYLKMYSMYAEKYEVAIQEHVKHMDNSSKYAKAMETCRETSGSKLSFESLVIQPIQRIPRYNLLLRDFLKHTPREHIDYDDVTKARDILEGVANGINEHVRQAEKARDFNAINTGGSLQFLVAPHRHLLYEGKLVNVERQREQYLILFNDLLLVANRKTEGILRRVRMEPEMIWDLELTWLQELTEAESVAAKKASMGWNLTGGEKEIVPEDVYFRVVFPEGQYSFACANPKEKTVWVAALSSAMSEQVDKLECGPEDARLGNHDYHSKVETYRGAWSEGKRQGEGTFSYFNGSNYNGAWFADAEHGSGVLAYHDKEVSKAQPDQVSESSSSRKGIFPWKRKDTEEDKEKDKDSSTGRMEEAGGEPSSSSASFFFYDGSFAHGLMTGRGMLSFATGDVYEGDILEGEFHGSGTMRWSCGTKFTGDWFHGAMIKGKMVSPSGITYEGKYNESGQRDGYGTMTYSHGSFYKGYWAQDLKDGVGEFRDAEGNVFSGNWSEGRKVNGTLAYAAGSTYKGDFRKDRRWGKGEMMYANDSVYSGDWLNNRRHGRGVHTFVDGAEYNGHWSCDRPQGHGVFATAGGTKFDGSWKDGRLEGKCTVVTSDGISYSGYVKSGKFTADNVFHSCFVPVFPVVFHLDE